MRRSTFVSFAVAGLMACAPTANHPRATTSTAPTAEPEPAIPAVLSAFDRYEVVAINAGHGMKDIDDFILALVRDPRFPATVNDIAVECGNSRYQPVLDRYIAGMDVPYAEVRKVWRDTTQSMMCGPSAFYERFFPLVRAINQRLPPDERLRVLAGDPPIDWDQVETRDDVWRYFQRDATIASVMEAEVLAKHRKALMLFGTFHLMHGQDGNAVSTYEKTYPDVTFVISDLGAYDTSRFASWPTPSLVPIEGTWLGALSPDDIWDPGVRMIDCTVQDGFPPELQRPVEDVVDAFLYLGPRDLLLLEPTPADIALDDAYMTELQRRVALTAVRSAALLSVEAMRAEIVQEAQQTILPPPPPPPDVAALEAECRAQQRAPAPTP
ncbi:MAG: hypothetical protein KC464_08550 [Myxococcales bacterium]|nr:hypothetical protein [Myxococcales bacterium]